MDSFLTIFSIALAFLCLIVYSFRAFRYCCNLLAANKSKRGGLFICVLCNSLLLSISLFCQLPVLLEFLILYPFLLLQFFFLFQGKLSAFLFGSGTFYFFLMNVKMIVSSIFILVYQIRSHEEFHSSGLYPFSVFLTLLVVLVLLEVFQKLIDRQMIQLLLKNSNQLYFVTTSLMLIDVYLLVLSVSYNSQAYFGLTAVFLLSTALLLFGAFFTSFLHAVRMSIMVEYEIKSRKLEKQLRESLASNKELWGFAFTDALTEVHNRRFALEALNRSLGERQPFCICYFDLDHLKYVNDTFGHNQGDQYILDVVRTLSAVFQKTDLLCRLGGDEFMILLPHTAYQNAEALAQTAYQKIKNLNGAFRPSISYGIVEVQASSQLSASEILQLADERMYAFKQAHKAAT